MVTRHQLLVKYAARLPRLLQVANPLNLILQLGSTGSNLATRCHPRPLARARAKGPVARDAQRHVQRGVRRRLACCPVSCTFATSLDRVEGLSERPHQHACRQLNGCLGLPRLPPSRVPLLPPDLELDIARGARVGGGRACGRVLVSRLLEAPVDDGVYLELGVAVL